MESEIISDFMTFDKPSRSHLVIRNNFSMDSNSAVNGNVDDDYYNMEGIRRAIIFYHYEYGFKIKSERTGTHEDAIRIKSVLESKQFKIDLCTDYTQREILEKLEQVRQETNIKCLLIFVMTHGDNSGIYAFDKKYNTQLLWDKFAGHPGFVGVPKLFFIQACRGELMDNGVTWTTDGPGKCPKNQNKEKIIPLMADFLIMHSTYEGHRSFRDSNGAWFVDSLYCVLKDEKNKEFDLLQLLTKVNRKIAFEFMATYNRKEEVKNKKQMPQIISMLTRLVKF